MDFRPKKAHLVASLGGLLGVKRPIFVIIVKTTIQSRFNMTNISQFSIETDVYLNHFSSDIFKNLDCGQDEPQK